MKESPHLGFLSQWRLMMKFLVNLQLANHSNIRHKKRGKSLPIYFLSTMVVLLLGVNYPLFTGNIRSELIFFPDAVWSGKWWLLFTHPLVHLSWYHLLLDSLAFMVLFAILEERYNWVKFFYVASAGLGALIFAVLIEPDIAERGLSGLSGIAHGLMAISGLEMLRRKDLQNLGTLCLGVLVIKCVFELILGETIFSSMHLGAVGKPMLACHAGGVLGGFLAYAALYWRDLRNMVAGRA